MPGFIGEQIRETIDALRAEAREATEHADAIERAWSEHDIDALERLLAISASQARMLREQRRREPLS